jgi:ADP-ribose pyrophosphatase YjhB (NUDIX family)
MPEPGKPITPIHFVPRFCSQCGAPLQEAFVAEENCVRLVCSSCRLISYLNPKVVAGAIPLSPDGRILLLRRGIEPCLGAWTFPAGFVELGETVAQAARREAHEETGADIRVGEVLGVYSYDGIGVVMVIYHAEWSGGHARTSREAMEVREFHAGEIPWDDLAFRSTGDALRDWVRLKGKS